MGRTLILGLGNPILRDDAVGLLVARRLHAALRTASPAMAASVGLLEASAAGLELLPLLAGYDRVVVVDAILSQPAGPGRLHRLTLAELPRQPTLTSVHGIGLRSAFELGRALGLAGPAEVSIYGVEVLDPYTFGEEPTPAVAAAIPAAVEAIRAAEFPERPDEPDGTDHTDAATSRG